MKGIAFYHTSDDGDEARATFIVGLNIFSLNNSMSVLPSTKSRGPPQGPRYEVVYKFHAQAGAVQGSNQIQYSHLPNKRGGGGS